MEIRVNVARTERKDVMAREEAQHANKEGQEREVVSHENTFASCPPTIMCSLPNLRRRLGTPVGVPMCRGSSGETS